MSNNNTQADELSERITKQAKYYSGFSEDEDHTPISKGQYYGYIAGATEYATKLHELQQEFTNIRNANKRWEESFNMAQRGYDAAYDDLQNLKEQFDHEMQKNFQTITAERTTLNDAKSLLELVRIRHESGLLPDRFVYDKIKKFLYGE